MNYLDAIDISASGLSAYRSRMNVIAENIANAETTETAQGGAYRRKLVVLGQRTLTTQQGGLTWPPFGSLATLLNSPGPGSGSFLAMSQLPRNGVSGLPFTGGSPVGVQVVGIRPDDGPLPRVYDPSHPSADADGYVEMPNVQLPVEMVDLVAAARAYEANTAVMEVLGKSIAETINLLS